MNKYWKPWEEIISILETGPYSGSVRVITAVQIKKWSGLEPRLMTKFDKRDEMPPALLERKLFILPVTNGKYGLAPGDGFFDLPGIPGQETVHCCTLPFQLESSDYGNSEAGRVDMAFNSGLLSRFTGIDRLYPTIRGRKYSPRFTFRVGEVDFPPVKSVQVEVDGGYEGRDQIVLLEAKVGRWDSFHLRQLYYPYRFWTEAVPKKRIRPIFFMFDPADSLYYLYEFEFEDPYDYLSVRCIRAVKYRLVHKSEDGSAPAGPTLEPEPDTPRNDLFIPQADSVERIMALPFLVEEGHVTAAAISRSNGITIRQANYYSHACQGLGLVKRKGKHLCLTPAGSRFVSLPPGERSRLIENQMARLPLIREIISELYRQGTLTRGGITAIITKNSNLSGQTPARRAKTLFSWLSWLYRVPGIVKAGKDSIFI